ncbi:MAG: sigma-70 family RNA polymerase sigma factor [Anaerolineales bacterium]
MDTLTLPRAGARMTELPDPDLVAQAQRGDMNAVGVLYDLHYLAVFRYFRARVGDREMAEDLTGDTFRRMLTGLAQYRVQGLPFRAWLFRIAHNLLVDYYRYQSSHTAVGLDEVELQSTNLNDTEVAVEQKLTMEQTYRALLELDQAQRDVVALRFLSELSLKETALALEKTEDAIKALQRRGLAALRLMTDEA